MELKVEEIDEVKRKLNIKVPEDVVASRVDKAYKDINRQVKMPGFRPGKIPMKILEKQVPLASMTDMWQNLMQEYYEKALQETGITPAGPPEIDHSAIEELKKDVPFSFSVVLDIKPSIKFTNYRGLKLKKREFTIKPEELQSSINQHLDPFGTFETLDSDHKIEVGDYVTMDFEGILKGETLEGGSARGYEVRIGEKKMIPGFEEQLLGKSKGDPFELKVTLPAEWNKKVRRVSMPIPGKDDEDMNDVATFTVHVKQIRKKVLPELTEEFVRERGEESLESFKRRVRGEIQAMKDHAEEVRVKQDIFDYLIKKHDVKPPDSLIKQEIKFMIDGMTFQIQQSGMKLEDSGFDPDQAEIDWRPRAEHNAKGYMILDGIAIQEKINVSQEDLEQEYERLSHETGKKPEEVKDRLYANPEAMHQTTQRIRGQKALNLIYSNCEFEFVKDSEFNEEKDVGVIEG